MSDTPTPSTKTTAPAPHTAKVIRTYARDMAIAQGKPVAEPAVVSIPVPAATTPLKETIPTPAPPPAPKSVQATPATEPAPLASTKALPSAPAQNALTAKTTPPPTVVPVAAPKPKAPEPQEHPGIPRDLVVMHRAVSKAPTEGLLASILRSLFGGGPHQRKEVIHEDITTPAHQETASSIAPPAPRAATQESREQVLARLRKKVETSGVPTERLVENSVLAKPASAPVPAPEPVRPTTFVPPPTTTTADKPSPLHTYKTDFVDHIRDTGASTTTIVAAEQDADTHATNNLTHPMMPVQKTNAVTVASVVGGTLFFIGSIVGLLYAYGYYLNRSAPVTANGTVPSLIFTDSVQKLQGSGTVLLQSLAHSAQKPLAQGTVRLTYVDAATTTLTGATTTAPAAGGYLIASLGLSLPDILMRNIALDSTVGDVHAGNQTRPFFILHVSSYDAAFAGMLRWEHTMAQDLAPLYPAYQQTTGTTTTAISVASSFVDRVVDNHDVRALLDTKGNYILLYGFWNKNTIVIARDPYAFIEIVNRLNSSSTQ